MIKRSLPEPAGLGCRALRACWDAPALRKQATDLMMRKLVTFFGLLSIFIVAASVTASEIDRFKGKWKSKTDFQGSEVDIHLEFDGENVKFDIGSYVGKAKLSQHGGFKMISFEAIKAGESFDALNPVDETSKHVYVFSYRSFTLASNFHAESTGKPKLTIYKKVE
ncbi:MAG: hypothetical protein M2R45_04654 [Verrucomicrobia subdivision 3 bacterium]|nr:hypothetical protein [Limisphaerales bacterium]MCS1417146.1 hypothetical protein [Limisphaerales bacterium]